VVEGKECSWLVKGLGFRETVVEEGMLMACHSIRTSFEKNGCKRTELQSKGDPDTKGMAPDVDARGAEG
jgi:hypothetical protein